MDVAVLVQMFAGVVLTGMLGAVGWLVRTVGTNQRRVDVLEAAQVRDSETASHVVKLFESLEDVKQSVAALEAGAKQISRVDGELAVLASSTRELALSVGNVNGKLDVMASQVNQIVEAVMRATE